MNASIKSPADIIADVFEECGIPRDKAKIAEGRLVKSLELLTTDNYQYLISVNQGKLDWGYIKKPVEES